jgi:hypothetical protein
MFVNMIFEISWQEYSFSTHYFNPNALATEKHVPVHWLLQFGEGVTPPSETSAHLDVQSPEHSWSHP